MTKLQKKKLNDKVAKLFTVKQLKEYLRNIPDNTVVCTIDHFGELVELDKYNFCVRNVEVSISTRHSEAYTTILALSIETPNIGPDPD